jgi:hypothetical protein
VAVPCWNGRGRSTAITTRCARAARTETQPEKQDMEAVSLAQPHAPKRKIEKHWIDCVLQRQKAVVQCVSHLHYAVLSSTQSSAGELLTWSKAKGENQIRQYFTSKSSCNYRYIAQIFRAVVKYQISAFFANSSKLEIENALRKSSKSNI